MKNYQVEGKDGKMYWVHRAIAVTGVVFKAVEETHEVFVLANKRGNGAADFQGMWNLPCGYLDFDETLSEACAREIKEETGYNLDPESLHMFGINDSIKENRQNVTARFVTVVIDEDMPAQEILAGGEEDEVEEIKWIPLEEINDYDWAFDHDKVIGNAFKFVTSF